MNKHHLKYYCKDCGVKITWQTALYGLGHCYSCAQIGKHLSIQTRKKISKAIKGKNHPFFGKHFSKKHRQRLSIAKIGNTCHLGKKHSYKTKEKLSLINKGKKHSKETKLKMSIAMIGQKHHFFGKHHTKETIAKISKANIGRHHSEKTKEKMSKARKGKKCYLWQGGISFFPYSTDFTKELKRKIRKRDNYTCQICGINEDKNYRDVKQIKLIVHHIDYNKQNCKDDNLISVCSSCHSKTNHNRDYWYAYCVYLMENR